VYDGGQVGNWLMLGNSAYTFVVTTVCLKALLECDSWTWVMVFFSIGSILSWFLFLWIYSALWPTILFGADMAGQAGIMSSSYSFWLAFLFIPLSTLLLDLALKSLHVSLFPTARDKICLRDKRFIPSVSSCGDRLGESVRTNGNIREEVRLRYDYAGEDGTRNVSKRAPRHPSCDPLNTNGNVNQQYYGATRERYDDEVDNSIQLKPL